MAVPAATFFAHEGPDGRDNDNELDDSEVDRDGDEEEEVEEGMPTFDLKTSQEAKLSELLRNINSSEAKLASDSSKELIKLLKSDSGGELLRYYVTASPELTELQDAWKLRRGKPELSRILRLISVVLDHPVGRYVAGDPASVAVSRVLDKFSKMIVEENLDGVYEELKSKDGKRQRMALLLMSSIVRRGSLSAYGVARNFDFKMPAFLKLAGCKSKIVAGRRMKAVARNAFIEFAMSFLEVGKPGLLRSILQQREMFSGVLRGLEDDDDENVVYILSTLRDRVLVPESLIPPGLRSVLFGTVTLDHLAKISGRENGGLAPKIAHDVLFMVCTDPSNGLMPDLNTSSLKGNKKRLIGLMKKLRATDEKYHRDLLLAIVKGRPSLGSAFFEEFPYNLEDPSSATWVTAVSLAADLVSSIRTGICWDFLDHVSDEPSAIQDLDLQNILRCICPSPFGRLVINKGLLHSDPRVKHGTLRLLLENLKLLDSLIDLLSLKASISLRREIQNEVRVLLPDPQLLFGLLSSLNNYSNSQTSLKRVADSGSSGERTKKLKMDRLNDDIDIVISGINFPNNLDLLQDSDEKGAQNMERVPNGTDRCRQFAQVWGLHQCSTLENEDEDHDVYFHCKLLEVLKIYHRTLHSVLEVSYDFFKIVPDNPLAVPRTLLRSLLSALTDHISGPLKCGFACGSLPPFYKYLQQFIDLLLYSPLKEIKDESHVLARAAMLSTGAFDSNEMEVGAWFLFLPGYIRDNPQAEDQEHDFFQKLSPMVVSFLCDAVSSIGNNLVKYWGHVKSYLCRSEDCKDLAAHFSPLVMCVLEKCLRLLSADSATFTLPERTMVSLYVCNTLKYILQTQVEAKPLSSLIYQFLLDKVEDDFLAADLHDISCEWRPIKYLFSFSQSILKGGTCYFNVDTNALCSNSSFVSVVHEVKEFLRSGCQSELVGISKAFYFSLICTAPDEIMKNFPSLLMISKKLLGIRSLLTSLLFLDPSCLSRIYKLFPNISSSVEFGATSKHDQLKQNDSTGTAFCSLLSQAPFHLLLPAIVIEDNEDHYSRMKEMLSAKVSRLTTDLLLPSLMLILFWIDQANLSSRYSANLSENVSDVCYALSKQVLQLLCEKGDTCFSNDTNSSASIQRRLHICETMFNHPAIISSLSRSLACGDETVDEILRNILEGTPLSGQRVSKKHQSVLSLVTEVSNYLVGMYNIPNSITANGASSDKIGKVFKRWAQHVIKMFRKRLGIYVGTQDVTYVVPVLYAILAFLCFISPFDLLELVHWLFSQADLQDPMLWTNSRVSPFHLGFCIAGGALEMLCRNLQVPYESEGWNSDTMWLESLYSKAVEFSTISRLESADMCLLKFLSAVQRSVHRKDLLPFYMKITRVVARTPIQIPQYCTDNIIPVRSKLLLSLVEISPLHMLPFGNVLSSILRCSSIERTGEGCLSDEGYLMLLPAALSCINSAVTKFGSQYVYKLDTILSFYSTILLPGFGNWRSFVDKPMFKVECSGVLPASSEQFLVLVDNSLLGKALHMLQYHFTINGVSEDERLRLFLAISPSSELLDFDIGDKDSCSVDQSFNLINGIVVNIRLCKMLLLTVDYQNQFPLKEGDEISGHPDKLSVSMNSARLSFIETLVSVWQWIVKKIPSSVDTAEEKNESRLLFKYLEVYTLGRISELVIEMHDALVQLDSIWFLKEIAQFSLLHRFGDLSTFKMLQRMLSSMSKSTLPTVSILQLLLSHSQLGPAIQTVCDSVHADLPGVVLKPISSILRSTVLPIEKSTSTNFSVKLEVIKLLRMLFYSKSRWRGSLSENDMDIDSSGLLFLLLSSYGATLSEIDLEIYGLMVEIESAEVGSGKLTELDYLWGSALLRTRGEQVHMSRSLPCNFMSEMDIDYRRSQFRDNIPIDSKLCIATVLHYPFERTTIYDPTSSEEFQQYSARNEPQTCSSTGEKVPCYDPVFILRFSVHCLSMDFLDSVEFAGLGLLAIALMSISSPDDGIRKLAYEVLGKFTDGLEKCRKKRESTRLRLLLTYLQNGIQEEWQRIPGTVAVFVAESSLILLDPSNDHYAAINKHLMQSSQINMKGIPFFHDCFWSSSVHCKQDRLWILSLLHTGMNSEEDSRIYVKESILEVLLSFYDSPLSDKESKYLILQILKKSAKIQKMAHHLVKNCTLISWITSILSSCWIYSEDQDVFSLKQLVLLVEVANDVVSCRSISGWLQTNACEQLTDLSFHLCKILVSSSKYFRGSKFVEKDTLLVSILRVLVTVLEISQKREAYLPQYNMSVCDLYHLYETVDSDVKYSPCAELALKAVLMSAPLGTIFDLDEEKLSLFLAWMVSTAMRLDSVRLLQQKEHSPFSTNHLREDKSYLSKLIRWLTASSIFRSISCKHKDWDSSFHPRMQNQDTLLSFLRYLETEREGTGIKSGSAKILAAVIFHLQQLLGGGKWQVLPSVVSALSLLLIHDAPSISGCSSILSDNSPVASICSRIRCPPESNPAWRWSYDKRVWADLSSQQTDMERLDELHACQNLLAILAELIDERVSDVRVALYHDLESSGVFEWERSILESGSSGTHPHPLIPH